MTETQDSLPPSQAEPASSDCAQDDASGLVAVADAEPCAEFAIASGTDLGGHTLLSRPPTPGGRRSLFRR